MGAIIKHLNTTSAFWNVPQDVVSIIGAHCRKCSWEVFILRLPCGLKRLFCELKETHTHWCVTKYMIKMSLVKEIVPPIHKFLAPPWSNMNLINMYSFLNWPEWLLWGPADFLTKATSIAMSNSASTENVLSGTHSHTEYHPENSFILQISSTIVGWAMC